MFMFLFIFYAFSTFADTTCDYVLDSKTFDVKITCDGGKVELIEGQGVKFSCPSGGDRFKGISIATLAFDVTFLTYASIDYVSWSVTNDTNRRLELLICEQKNVDVNQQCSKPLYSVGNMPNPTRNFQPGVFVSFPTENVTTWRDLGQQGAMWMAGGMQIGLDKSSTNAKSGGYSKSKNKDGVVVSADVLRPTLTTINGPYQFIVQLSTIDATLDAFSVVLSTFTGAGDAWKSRNGFTLSSLSCSPSQSSSSSFAVVPTKSPTKTEISITKTMQQNNAQFFGVGILFVLALFVNL